MIFYNGFNLLVDLALVAVVYVVAHGVGYRKGLDKNKPPFQATRQGQDLTKIWIRAPSRYKIVTNFFYDTPKNSPKMSVGCDKVLLDERKSNGCNVCVL